MKGYAKVKVNTDHREKIDELVGKIDSERKELQDLYDSTRHDDRFNRVTWWFAKRQCYDTVDHACHLIKHIVDRKFNFVDFNHGKYVTGYERFKLIETYKAKAIRKISNLATKDEILLDDELMSVWNEYVEANQ